MNQLEYRQDFEDVLKDYRLSNSAAKILSEMRLAILSGPSGSGRNTIIEQLLKSGDYSYIVSDTTRQPRSNNGVMEVNGVNYWFRREADFIKDLKAGNFLEAEIIHNQQVSGISIRELEKAYRAGKIAITEVEIGGFKNILGLKPDVVGIFILPPSFEVWLDRLFNRGAITQAELSRRLSTGIRIFKEATTINSARIIINDDLGVALKAVDDIIKHGNATGHDHGLEVAKYLLKRTRAYLDKRETNS